MAKQDNIVLNQVKNLFKLRNRMTIELVPIRQELQGETAMSQLPIAPHQVLPDELLGHIFYSVDYDPYVPFYDAALPEYLNGKLLRISPKQWLSRCPINATQVCRRWREVASASPKLWCRLVVDIRKEDPVAMMEHWLKCAKALPVHLTIWQEEFQTNRERIQNTIQSVMIALGPQLPQLASLKLLCQSKTNPSLSLVNQDIAIVFEALDQIPHSPAPLFKTLVVDSVSMELSLLSSIRQRGSMLPVFPSHLLRNLETLHIRLLFLTKRFPLAIPANLSVLKLDGPPFGPGRFTLLIWGDECIDLSQLLSYLPRLTRLRIGGIYPPYRASLQPNNLIHLENLERLTVAGYHCSTHLPLLHCPKLKSFKFKGGYEWGDVMRTWPTINYGLADRSISTFLNRNGASIRRFALGDLGGRLGWDVFNSWWRKMGGLDRLIIKSGTRKLDCPMEQQRQEGWVFRITDEIMLWEPEVAIDAP